MRAREIETETAPCAGCGLMVYEWLADWEQTPSGDWEAWCPEC